MHVKWALETTAPSWNAASSEYNGHDQTFTPVQSQVPRCVNHVDQLDISQSMKHEQIATRDLRRGKLTSTPICHL